MASCAEINSDIVNALDAQNLTIENDIRNAVQTFMGRKEQVDLRLGNSLDRIDRRAHKAWNEAYEALVNHLLNNYKLNPQLMATDNYLLLMKTYLQRKLGVAVSKESLFERANSYRVIAASKFIKTLILLHQTRFGKKLNAWERAGLPATLFVMRADPFGAIFKFTQKAINLSEDSRRYYSQFDDRYNKVMSKYIHSLRNSVAYKISQNGGIVSPNMIYRNRTINSLDDINLNADNILKDGIQDMQTVDKRIVTYFGTIQKRDGSIVHLVVDQKTMQKMEIPEEHLSNISIQNRLSDRYAFELVNDIMHGEIRHIQWSDYPTNPEHLDKIHKLLRKRKLKAAMGESKKGEPEVGITTVGRTKYIYAMFRNGNTHANPDGFTGYLIRTETEGEKPVDYFKSVYEGQPPTPISEINKSNIKIFKDGYYRAGEYVTYGSRYSERETPQGILNKLYEDSSERGWDYSNLNQRYMNVQPDEMLTSSISETKSISSQNEPYVRSQGIETANLWDTITRLRSLYSDIARDLESMSKKELALIEKWIGKNGILTKTLSAVGGKNGLDSNQVLKTLKELFDISNRIWVDSNGNIHTPNSHFIKMADGTYAPVVYENDVVTSMLDNAIEDMKSRITTLTDPDNIEKLQRKIDEFELTKYRREDPWLQDEVYRMQSELGLNQEQSSAILAERNTHLKHRAEWTDLALRKKGSDVHKAYLQTVYYSMAKNNLMISMLETIDSVIKMNNGDFAADVYDWIVNRTKIAFSNPTAFGGVKNLPVFGKEITIDYSTSKFVDFLKKHFPDRNWTIEGVQHWLNWTKGFFGAALLGYSTGLTNNTQIINPIIRFGFDSWEKASKILKNEDKSFPAEWADAIIAHAGTDEVVNMVMDAISKDSDIDFRDAGLISIPGIPVQYPKQAMRDFVRMARQNRDSFVKKGIPQISIDNDIKLRKVEIERNKNRTQRVQLKIDAIREKLGDQKLSNASRRRFEKELKLLEREESRLSSESQRRTIQELRELYLDIILTPKAEQNSKVLEARFRRLMVNITDNRMKRMIGWKLSWWPSGFNPELFTMTEGERRMRKLTVIMALRDAESSGSLGSIDMTKTKPVEIKTSDGETRIVNVPEIYLSDHAVHTARNAVANFMFGMSPVNLSEAFVGMGQHFGLYKAYPLQQILHDADIFDTFIKGNSSKEEILTRLIKAATQATNRSLKGLKYNANDKTIDQDALAVIRLLGLRASMTVLTAATEMIPIVRYFFRTPLQKQFSTMIRGGENPIFAIAFRLMINGLIMAAADGDDDELFSGGIPEVGFDIMRLFLPVFFTLPLNLIANWVKD